MTHQARLDAVLDYIETHPGCSQPEIAQVLGLNQSQTQNSLNTLFYRQLIGRQPELWPNYEPGRQLVKRWLYYSARVVAS